MRWLLRALTVALIGFWLLLIPSTAQAHAVLVSSTPPAGAKLGVTPGVVLLTFDEPLVARLSHATVTDPTGSRFSSSVSRETMRVPLTSNAPGVYRVDWTTVSQLDGHTVTGGFQFGVGVTTTTTRAGNAPSATRGDILVAAARAVEYTILMLACGLALLRWLRRGLPMRVPAVSTAAALLASGVAVVLGEVALATSGKITASGLADYLTLGVTGWARVVRIGLEAGLLSVALTRRMLSPWLLAAIIGATAVAGHSADIDPTWAGVLLNACHLAAAALWAGGIMALAYLRFTSAWEVGRAVLPRFSRVAPWAFGGSVTVGAVQAILLLGGPGELLGSAYGRTLVVKAIIIALMIPLSLLAWRRVRTMVRSEALLAILVVAAAALLSAYPVVPKEFREAAQARGSQSAQASGVSPFPRPGDLTMGGQAGGTLVGLTLHPGRPGRNQVFAYLSPSPAAGTPVRLAVDDHWSSFTSCGDSCWSATADVPGRAELKVAVGGTGGGTSTFSLPALPAPDGTALAERAAHRMDSLNSYRVGEVLSGVKSEYAYARPHAMRVSTWYGETPRETVWLGPNIYVRSSPKSSWKLQSSGGLAPVPYFVWNPFKPFVNPTIVGTTSVGGVPVTQVSFFGGHGDDPEAVWFMLWIDPVTDRVLRSQMFATSHNMDDHYFAFDKPITITNPMGR